jgi:hypothetical protein
LAFFSFPLLPVFQEPLVREDRGPVVKEEAQAIGTTIFHLFESELDFVPRHRLTVPCTADPLPANAPLPPLVCDQKKSPNRTALTPGAVAVCRT